MRKALILGAGGHSRVVISLLKELSTHSIIGVVDVNSTHMKEPSSEAIMQYPVLALDAFNSCFGHKDLDIFLAIGDCKIRQIWWERSFNAGLSMPNLLSHHAVVDPTAKIGTANIICPRAYIGPEVNLGSNNLINTGVILEHESSVQNHCHIAPRSLIAGRSKVADSCFIGAGSVIIDGITLVDHTTIGAGAVVIADIISSHGLYVGVPAQRISESNK